MTYLLPRQPNSCCEPGGSVRRPQRSCRTVRMRIAPQQEQPDLAGQVHQVLSQATHPPSLAPSLADAQNGPG
jgi:hypothetical protein